MEYVDTQEITDIDEEDMFLRDVVGDEHELLAIDIYLREVFGKTDVEEEESLL